MESRLRTQSCQGGGTLPANGTRDREQINSLSCFSERNLVIIKTIKTVNNHYGKQDGKQRAPRGYQNRGLHRGAVRTLMHTASRIARCGGHQD